MSERALPPVVTALISPRSVKSCANIEWSITQTNDRRTTGRSLSLSLSNIGATVKHNLTPLNAHTHRLAQPVVPPSLPIHFLSHLTPGCERAQNSGETDRNRRGRRDGKGRVKTTISTSQFAAERHRRRPTDRRGSRRRRCAHPAGRPSSFLLLMMEQKSFSFSKSQI